MYESYVYVFIYITKESIKQVFYLAHLHDRCSLIEDNSISIEKSNYSLTSADQIYDFTIYMLIRKQVF